MASADWTWVDWSTVLWSDESRFILSKLCPGVCEEAYRNSCFVPTVKLGDCVGCNVVQRNWVSHSPEKGSDRYSISSIARQSHKQHICDMRGIYKFQLFSLKFTDTHFAK